MPEFTAPPPVGQVDPKLSLIVVQVAVAVAAVSYAFQPGDPAWLRVLALGFFYRAFAGAPNTKTPRYSVT